MQMEQDQLGSNPSAAQAETQSMIDQLQALLQQAIASQQQEQNAAATAANDEQQR